MLVTSTFKSSFNTEFNSVVCGEGLMQHKENYWEVKVASK